MRALRRWAIRAGTALGITLGLWVVALVSSTLPGLAVLGTNVHGLSLADYRVTPLRHLAPLSDQVIQDVRQDQSPAGPNPTPRPTPNATPRPSSILPPTPSVLPSVQPTPPPVLPSLPPLPPTPTVPPTPSVPPLPTPTPSLPPLPTPVPTPTLPPPPPLP
jgi:hypothetical protein